MDGDTYFHSTGLTGIIFTFDAGILGTLPTHAGLVWTDGGGTITFEAFDAGGGSLGALVGSHADGSILGTTGEDRFYGVIDAGGISALKIQNASGGIEIDHLQYGHETANASIPEPSTWLLFGVVALYIVGYGWRRCRQSES